MKTVLMGGSEETRSWTSEDEGPRWARSASCDGNGEETPNMQLAEPAEDLTRKSSVCCLSLRMVSLGSLGDLLTCSRFRLCEERAGGFPSRLIQDVERIVNFGVGGGEWPETANAADDGHVLVHQGRHPLAVQVTAVSVVT